MSEATSTLRSAMRGVGSALRSLANADVKAGRLVAFLQYAARRDVDRAAREEEYRRYAAIDRAARMSRAELLASGTPHSGVDCPE